MHLALVDAQTDDRTGRKLVHAGQPRRCSSKAARTSVGLDRLVADHALGSLAYYYKGTGIEENEDALSSIILGTSLLTARGIPVAGSMKADLGTQPGQRRRTGRASPTPRSGRAPSCSGSSRSFRPQAARTAPASGSFSIPLRS